MSTFISYSRVHSPFVVRLAKDLKNAGFDVFLDQLDIPKGARWDDEIEAAVERSSIFMIVLAPESIESQNVKDELSYAIDAGKHILPVVIQPCKIPLRLRRFQYVNFTDKPYKDSLSEIKHLLSNTQQIPRAAVEKPFYEKEDDVPLVKGPLIAREQAAQATAPTEFKPPADNRLRKLAVPSLLGVVALAAITAVVVYAGRSRNTPVAPETAPTITSTEILPTATSTSTLAPPPVQITDPRGGAIMRLVSAGEFIMGSENGLPDEKPEQTVYLDSFYIDQYEVTNALYRECVAAGACQPPQRVNSVTHVAYYSREEFDNYPVVYVDWYMANNYCAWRGARLPTEAEWEKAARGIDGRTYPWGEQISCDEANYAGCQKDTADIFSYGNGMSPYAVRNMAGNVYEWVNSLYVPYPYNAIDGREDPNVIGDRVIRGGSWLKSSTEDELRTSRRQRIDPSTAAENIGFRCVHSLDFLVPDTGQAIQTPRNSFTATSIAATERVHKTREAVAGPNSSSVASSTPPPGPTGVQVLIAPRITPTSTESSVPTPEPPTIEPPTVEPPTVEPPTQEPPTEEPPTEDPPPATEPPTVP